MSNIEKLRYVGSNKIVAIKAIRTATNISFKEANDAVNASYFLVTKLQRLAIIGAYLMAAEFAKSYSSPRLNLRDWKVESKTPASVINLSGVSTSEALRCSDDHQA